MPERDGYIPGVPCALDTTQPDPEAAARFYSGLFGWECENVMPPEVEAKYFVARLRGRDVAAAGSIEAHRRRRPGTPISGSIASTRPPQRSAMRAGTY